MGIKTLEILIEEIDRDNVNQLRLLSGPAHVTDRVKKSFERFATELQHEGVNAEWRFLSTDFARQFHARVLFDEESIWELPPLNALLQGTVDSIRPSSMPRSAFDEAWTRDDVQLVTEVQPETGASRTRTGDLLGAMAQVVQSFANANRGFDQNLTTGPFRPYSSSRQETEVTGLQDFSEWS